MTLNEIMFTGEYRTEMRGKNIVLFDPTNHIVGITDWPMDRPYFDKIKKVKYENKIACMVANIRYKFGKSLNR